MPHIHQLQTTIFLTFLVKERDVKQGITVQLAVQWDNFYSSLEEDCWLVYQ